MTPGADIARAAADAPPDGLPVITASAGQPLGDAGMRPQIEQALRERGGVLLRGFAVGGAEAFRGFAAGFGEPLLGYDFGSTPRSKLGDGVYSSTEYPAHQHIPLHNEQSYARDWPMKIWFYCQIAAELGGETPLADSRAVYRRIDPAIRRRFTERGLAYVRNYGNGLDLPWQRVFDTDDPAAAEAYGRAHAIELAWKSDGELRTRQIAQAVAVHPRSREPVWFNQAHLFHVSALEPAVREALLEVVEPEDLPRNVYYGDGGAIEPAVLDEIRAVYAELAVASPWQVDDVVMLDNMLVAHGRTPFTGPRKVLVAMAEPHRAAAA